MNLADDWKRIAKRAWSFRLNIVAALLGAAEVYFTFIDPGTLPDWIPPGSFAAIATLTSLAAGIARLVAQKELSRNAGKSDQTIKARASGYSVYYRTRIRWLRNAFQWSTTRSRRRRTSR